ncbi:MAG: thioesterase family protein, partial [Acidimicrobiales bacterium]
MADAFYAPLGEERYAATEHTSGPWAPGAQHFGPPSALLVRGLERIEAPHPSLLARVTVEILGPAPVAELDQRSWVERPGRSVELLHSELSAAGRLIARATAWRIATTGTESVATDAGPLLPSAEAGTETAFPDDWSGGYLQAIEWRAVRGGISAPGPAAVWGRQRIPLV